MGGNSGEDGSPDERGTTPAPPPTNVATVRANGPLIVHAQMTIEGHGERVHAAFCRCGASKRKPFCDGTHATLGFEATGEPEPQPEQAAAERSGPVRVRPVPNGPLKIDGALEICSASGRSVACVAKTWLCRCGASTSKPFCDGSHNRIGFTTE